MRRSHALLSLSGLLVAALSGCSAPSSDGGAAPDPNQGRIEARDPASDAVVLNYEGGTITFGDVEPDVRGTLNDLDQQRFEAIEAFALRRVNEILVDARAEAEGLDRQAYLEREIASRNPTPTEEQIQIFYQQNLSQMRGRSVDEVRGQISDYLVQQGAIRTESDFLAELRRDAGVSVTLDPPRLQLDLPESAMARNGGADAPVTLVEFADFECTFCRRAHTTVERLLAEYGDTIRYVFVDHPLDMHERAVPASVAARCADEQGEFWNYHENLMVMRGDLSDADLAKRARDLGLDTDMFNACYQSNRYADTVNALLEHGQRLGISATPTFFVNGRMISGAKSYDDFKAIIDAELEG